ncbi:MAG: VWA domain-containing protein [Chloroflexi bacterium]|nr:VWA domain-containing protein [Chloroflexota bacterium]
MKLILSMLGLLALLPSGILLAATASSDVPPAYRYLILIDTSFSMARTREATARTVRELIVTGVQGRMNRGDTLGIWTFNEEVETRRFPICLWAPEQKESLAERAVYSLRKERFEKQTRMDKALAEMFKAVQSSESLTIFIISDGDEPIVGTPFDRSINAIFRQYARSLRREKKPFVTMFVAQDGALNSWSAHTGGSVIVLPDLPPPRRAVQEAVASTIVTNVAPLPTAEAVAVTPPTAPPIEAAKKEPVPDSAKAMPPTQAPVSLPPAVKQVEAVAARPLPPGATGPDVAKPIPQSEPLAPPTALTPDILKPSTTLQTAAPVPSTVPSESSPPAKAPAAKEPTESAKPIVAEIVIRKATETPAARTTTAQPTASVTPPSATPPASERASGQASKRSPKPSAPSSAVASKAASTPPPAGVIVPPDENITSWRFLALGSLLVLISGLFLLYRNYRAPRQPSFISRSMNSEEK